ncbi:MAG TPA: ORF6N domain-containing protein [bacterium]|nr:ORF6N domain-containing protein [bacterium]
MSQTTLIAPEKIERKICFIREQKVMLDRDLAELYEVETFNLNKAVKRNIERFPAHFMFQLTESEFRQIKTEISNSIWGGRRTLPYAFTDKG